MIITMFILTSFDFTWLIWIYLTSYREHSYSYKSTIAYLQDVVRTIGETPTDSRTAVPKKTVKIIDCGIVGIEKKYELTEAQAESNEDL